MTSFISPLRPRSCQCTYALRRRWTSARLACFADLNAEDVAKRGVTGGLPVEFDPPLLVRPSGAAEKTVNLLFFVARLHLHHVVAAVEGPHEDRHGRRGVYASLDALPCPRVCRQAA